jgi:hypothetical protein
MALMFCSCQGKPPNEELSAERATDGATAASPDIAEVGPVDAAANAEAASDRSPPEAADAPKTAESPGRTAEQPEERTPGLSAAAAPVASDPRKASDAADWRVAGQYPLQDNPLAGCSLCHVDVEDEYVGSKHFKKKVGCKTCHGPSEGHLADENNEVKPDEAFAREDVDRLCSDCHECGRPEKSKPASGADGRPKVCTDCHGQHDLTLAQQTATPEP